MHACVYIRNICLFPCRLLIVWGDVHRFVSQEFEDPPFGGVIHEYEYPGVYYVCLSIFKTGSMNIATTVCEYVTVR